MKLLKYSGGLQAKGFIDWLKMIERIFEYKDVPEDKKVKLVALKLKGRASAWWEQMKKTRQRKGKPKITNLEHMKKKNERAIPVFQLYSSPVPTTLEPSTREPIGG